MMQKLSLNEWTGWFAVLGTIFLLTEVAAGALSLKGDPSEVVKKNDEVVEKELAAAQN